jgi:hypothetical protein
MPSKLDAQAAVSTVAVALTAAAASYFITKRVYENKIVSQRSEAYQRDRAESEALKAERKSAALPSGKRLE